MIKKVAGKRSPCLLILAAGTIALFLLLTAAKPAEPFTLLWGEITVCGWECDDSDDVAGIDETYAWAAEGELHGSWSHTYDTTGYRTAKVRVWWKGNAEATIDINGVVFTEVYRLRGQRTLEGCLEYVGDITITVTGEGNLAAWGSDTMAWQAPPFEC